MSELVVNGRFRQQKMTGIQRVAEAITSRLSLPHRVVEPQPSFGSGIRGHMWEQCVLSQKAKGKLVWGPCNTGPLASDSLVLTIHDASVFDHPEWFGTNFVRLNKHLWPALAKRALRVVTVSEFSKQRLSRVLDIPETKIEVVWNGVDESFRPSSEEQVLEATASVGVANRPYFATLCTLESRKNLRLVLRAWSRAKAHLGHGVALLVIGEKGSKAVFGSSGLDVDVAGDDVFSTGYVSDEMLPALLSGAQAVLYPSLYEGFGLPLLEGMACGTPVVTTKLTSLPEVGSDAALYVDPQDPECLAGTILRLANSADLRAKHRQLGLERAKLFNWDKTVSHMENIFRNYL